MKGITTVRRTVAVLATTAMVLVGGGVAQAAVTSHITATYAASTGHFHGKVTSGTTECIAHRSVKLFKKTSSGKTLVGMTSSGAGGGWTIDVMHAHGKYFAKIPTETEMTTQCGGAKSPVVDVM